MPNYTKPLFSVESVSKTFQNRDRPPFVVLEPISFTFYEREIVALLGKSGSGKSTLLRIIAGLLPASSGQVTYKGEPIQGPVRGIAMVFQSFALMPWLTVLENVELGLEALGLPRAPRRKRALAAIDAIGLDGFESAYPKELSGGMQQRVGLARALVVDPELLVMDEPFSALDVLTAETLRNDVLDLWQLQQTQTKGILFVTHNIEEAVLIADRIMIFGSDPGHIRAELPVELPRPRDPESPPFRALVDHIYTLMTSTAPAKETLPAAEWVPQDTRIPLVESAEFIGLLETLADWDHRSVVDLPEIAEYLHLHASDLFPLTEALELLGFAQISKGDIQLTPSGLAFAKAGILERKQRFAKHLQASVPLARYILTRLQADPHHRISEDFFLKTLETRLSPQEAERTLRIMIDWGRYAECFAYDYDSGILSLEDPK